MTQETMLRDLLTEIRELKAMITQLGPVQAKTTVAQEIAACRAQGIDVAAYFKAKGAAAPGGVNRTNRTRRIGKHD